MGIILYIVSHKKMLYILLINAGRMGGGQVVVQQPLSDWNLKKQQYVKVLGPLYIIESSRVEYDII